MSDSQRPHGLQPPRLLHPWNFPGKSTGMGCHCILQVYTYNLPNIVHQLYLNLKHQKEKTVLDFYKWFSGRGDQICVWLSILLAEARALPQAKLYKGKFIFVTLIFSTLPILPSIFQSSGFITASSLLFGTCPWKLLGHINVPKYLRVRAIKRYECWDHLC